MVSYTDPPDNADRYKGNDIDSDGDGTVDAADDLAGGLSVQTPQDIEASRSKGTQYTNTTGNPLLVTVTLTRGVASDELSTYFDIDEVPVSDFRLVTHADAAADERVTHTGVVPDGETYRMLDFYSANILVWVEQELSI